MMATLAILAGLAGYPVMAGEESGNTNSAGFCNVADEGCSSEGCGALEGCGCDPSNDGCGHRGCSFVAGVEAVFLTPNISRDNVYFYNSEIGEFASTDFARLDTMEGSPRIWLGIENDAGWGIRTRYWTYDAEANGGLVDLGGGAPFSSNLDQQLFAACEQLDLQTIDLELTKRFCVHSVDCLASFGIRYADRSIDDSFVVNIRDQFLSFANLLNDQADGTGLTGSIEGALPIGDRGFSIVAGARGSVLWGKHQSSATYHLYTVGGESIADVFDSLSNSDNATTYIVEAQLGVRWQWRLECVCTDVFTQLAYEYQRWDTEACLTADYYAFTNLTPGALTEVGGTTLGSELEFNGLAWSIGFKR